MLNQKINELNCSIDELKGAFSYNEGIAIHQNFVLYLKEVFNEVPSQYLSSYIAEKRITIQVDANCQINMAQRIHFVFMQFLNEHIDPKFEFYSVLLEWT